MTSTGTPKSGYVQVLKKSSSPEMTTGNDCYSLSGAEYGLYSDIACKTLITKLTTGSDSYKLSDNELTTNKEEIAPGTYYVKEITASKGYTIDMNVHTVKVTASNTASKPFIITSEEIPDNDPVVITMHKIWKGEETDTVPSLAGTQFTITFYGGQYDTVEEAETAVTNNGVLKRQWVIEVKYDTSNNLYMAMLGDDYIVSGDELFYDNGTVTLPYGTLVTQETKAAPGYTLSGVIKDKSGNIIAKSDGNSGMIYIAHITADNGEPSIDVGNEYSSYDSPVYHSFNAVKYDANGVPVEGVKYSLSNSNGDVVGTATTDVNGKISFSNLYPDKYYLTETKTLDGMALLAEPIEVNLPQTISLEEAKTIDLDTDADGVIYVPETTDTDGNVTEAYYLLSNQTFEITDHATYTLPKTGGNGTWCIGLIVLGIMAFITSLIFIIPKKNSETHN